MSPDPTPAIQDFLRALDRARAVGLTPSTQHVLAEHLFKGTAKVIFYSSMRGVMSIVGDEDVFGDIDDFQVIKLIVRNKQRQVRRRRAALAVAAFAREVMAIASVDTHPKDGDVEQAPLVSGAVPKADAQTPSPHPETNK